LAALLAGLGGGYFVRKMIAEAKISSAETAALKIIEEANQEANAIKREKQLEAKEEAHRLRSDLEKESRERRSELQRLEKRLVQKEESLDRKINNVEQKEEALRCKENDNKIFRDKLDQLHQQQLVELERVSGMTSEEAKELLLQRVREEIDHEMMIMVKDMENQAKTDGDKKAREIVTRVEGRKLIKHQERIDPCTLPAAQAAAQTNTGAIGCVYRRKNAGNGAWFCTCHDRIRNE
jgi:ribonuclease Y